MLALRALTLEDLVKQQSAWNELWEASESHTPLAKVEGIELWTKSFAAEHDFVGLVVERDGLMMGGLPLIRKRSKFGVPTYRLPSDGSVDAGDLLMVQDEQTPETAALLAQGLLELPGPLALFDPIEIHSPRWQQLLIALNNRGAAAHVSDGHPVGVVDIGLDWENYRRSWSGNHRSMIKRCRNKLARLGEVSIERLQTPSDNLLRDVLERCFVIEDQGWKGRNGTSILRTSGMTEYYHQEARLMRDCGALDLWLLKLDGQIIAFEYCHNVKGVCLSHKISFDPQHHKLSPGRVLRSYQLEAYFDEEEMHLLDTLGVMCEAKAKWATRTYTMSRCFVSLGGALTNAGVRGFQLFRTGKRALRRSAKPPQWPTPGASDYRVMREETPTLPDDEPDTVSLATCTADEGL